MSIYIGSNRYKAMVGSNRADFVTKKALPYDAEVEWLYMPYGSYINTGIMGLKLDSFDITCVVKADGYPSIASSFFGVYGNEDRGKHSGGVMIRQYPEGTLNFFYGNYQSNGDTTRNIALPSDFVTLRITPTASYYNGERVGNAYSAYTATMPNNQSMTMHLNCRKDYRNAVGGIVDEVTGLCAGWYKRFVCIYDTVTVCDYIPVRVGQTGYMYDKVSGTLFGNDGTGSFTLGPDKN